MIAFVFLQRIARSIPPTGWIIMAVIAAFLLSLGYCSHRAVQAERARQAVEAAKTERRASSARETASVERLNDTLTIQDRQKERDHAAQALPDGVPDDREFRRRCRQLRDAGRSLPACDRLADPG